MCPAPKFSVEEQQRRIIDAAESCIEQSSLLDFTMSSVSKAAGLSMGSVYKFVQTKEDVLVALAAKSLEHRFLSWKTVMEIPMSLPERTLATYLIASEKLQCFSFGFDLEKFVTNDAVLKRASDGWVLKLVQAERQFDEMYRQQLRDAIAAGELSVTPETEEDLIAELSLSLWSLYSGFQQVDAHLQARQRVGVETQALYPLKPRDFFIASVQRLLNGYDWSTPLTDTSVESVCARLEQQGLR